MQSMKLNDFILNDTNLPAPPNETTRYKLLRTGHCPICKTFVCDAQSYCRNCGKHLKWGDVK